MFMHLQTNIIHLHYDDDDDRDDNNEIKQTGESINNTIRPICDLLYNIKDNTVQPEK